MWTSELVIMFVECWLTGAEGGECFEDCDSGDKDEGEDDCDEQTGDEEERKSDEAGE